jgi:Cdc6-like AAA superfamily ATPase
MTQSSLSTLLENLHESIAHFSDGNLLMDSKNQGEQELGAVEDDDSVIRKFAPPGLEEPFRQLCSVIFPNVHHESGERLQQDYDEHHDNNKNDNNQTLLSSNDSPGLDTKIISSSSAAILMGSKGSGKSLLLERCLAACRQYHLKRRNIPLFYKVSINGILCRGQDVGAVVYEIIRQLSEIAFNNSTNEEDMFASFEDNNNDNGSAHDICNKNSAVDEDEDNKTCQERERKRRRRLKMDKHILRLRRSAFTSNVALLEATLQIAHADGIPILLILDELDSFLEEGQRQMLLYFFLDRVATTGSNLIFIGITSSFSTLTLLEKRIRSRAEGTAKIIYLRNPSTYADLLAVLQHQLKDCTVGDQMIARLSCLPNNNSDEQNLLTATHQEINNNTKRQLCRVPEEEIEEATIASVTMERELRLGRDLRWYSRVMSTALSLYRHECMLMASNKVDFHTKYILNALVMLGGKTGDVTNPSSQEQPDLCIVNGMAVDPRLQALLNLSMPEVALLLSAKRILIRQSHKDDTSMLSSLSSSSSSSPLTLDRLLKEFESFRRRSSSTHFSNTMLKKAVLQLLDVGLLMPVMDHVGGGPFQYGLSKSYRNLDTNSLFRLPLQMLLDIDRELAIALEQNLVTCSTALKEWGKATT